MTLRGARGSLSNRGLRKSHLFISIFLTLPILNLYPFLFSQLLKRTGVYHFDCLDDLFSLSAFLCHPARQNFHLCGHQTYAQLNQKVSSNYKKAVDVQALLDSL